MILAPVYVIYFFMLKQLYIVVNQMYMFFRNYYHFSIQVRGIFRQLLPQLVLHSNHKQSMVKLTENCMDV